MAAGLSVRLSLEGFVDESMTPTPTGGSLSMLKGEVVVESGDKVRYNEEADSRTPRTPFRPQLHRE